MNKVIIESTWPHPELTKANPGEKIINNISHHLYFDFERYTTKLEIKMRAISPKVGKTLKNVLSITGSWIELPILSHQDEIRGIRNG